MEQEEFIRQGIVWTGKGYFGVPDPPSERRSIEELENDPWSLVTTAFGQARSGDFSIMPRLVEICDASQARLWVRTATDLLGDAGPAGCFDTVTDKLTGTRIDDLALNLCRALYFQGKLSSVPHLVAAYERFAKNQDFEIVPDWVSDLLDPDDDSGGVGEPTGYEEIEDYRDAALRRYEQLVGDLGSADILVFQGEQFGVIKFTRFLLDRIRRPHVRSVLRHKFEALTAVDCTTFYKDGIFQPLSAAAVIEEFLDSPATGAYEHGVRYFFGHRIPD